MKIRLLVAKNNKEIVAYMRSLGVDKSGIKIMAGKGQFKIMKIEHIQGMLANVLKQEMLSLGGEVALPRGVITGRLKYTDCLIFATDSQYLGLVRKLKRQPWGLDKIGQEINDVLENLHKQTWGIKAGKFHLNLGKKTVIMGVLNITPDSFSDGMKFFEPAKAIEGALKMERDGADIIDIGGQSTRPGAANISVREELKRVTPVIKVLSKRLRIPISIDTCKSEVAQQAIEAGASMVNDVSGLCYDRKMKDVVAKLKVPVVIMHMKGNPRTMQNNPVYKSLMSEIITYLNHSIKMATDAGIGYNRIIIDPGIGFGKNVEHNLSILDNLHELKILGLPILIGISRKSFIGKILGLGVNDRIYGTIASLCLAIINGAHILRVHDIKEAKQAAAVIDSVLNTGVLN